MLPSTETVISGVWASLATGHHPCQPLVTSQNLPPVASIVTGTPLNSPLATRRTGRSGTMSSFASRSVTRSVAAGGARLNVAAARLRWIAWICTAKPDGSDVGTSSGIVDRPPAPPSMNSFLSTTSRSVTAGDGMMIDRRSNNGKSSATSTVSAVARSENPWSDFSATATCLRTTVGSSDKVQVTGPLIVTRLPMPALTVSVSQSRTCVVAFSHNQSGAAATITRRASAPPHRAIRADDCRIDFTSSSGKPGARPYVAGLRHAADVDSHRDRNTSWSRLFKLLLFGRRRWIVLEGFFHRFFAQIDVFFPGISAGIFPPKPRGKHAPARSDGDHCIAWGERMAMDASPDRAGRVG